MAGRAAPSGEARNAGTSRCTRGPSAASSTWSTTLVDELTPITQKHTIVGLVMGEQ